MGGWWGGRGVTVVAGGIGGKESGESMIWLRMGKEKGEGRRDDRICLVLSAV